MTSTKKINKALTVLLMALSLCHLTNMSPVLDNSSENQTVDNDFINNMQQDRQSLDYDEQSADFDYTNTVIEQVKARILRNLNKKEAPRKHVPIPALQTLHFRQDSRCNETIDQLSLNSTKRTRSEFLYANVENAACFNENGTSCLKFHFDLPQQVQNRVFESIELWLYKKQSVTQFSITRIISNDDEEDEKLTTTLYNQTFSEGWIRFNVSEMFRNENVTTFDLQLATESGEWCLEFEGDKIPFLLVQVEDRRISKRSANDCPTENSTCCRKIYFVRFRDIGWGDWVIQPDGFDANYCSGTCTSHAGMPQKHHGSIFMTLCETNPAKARKIGKTECITCSPITYESMSVIYLAEEGVRVVHDMPDMSVVKCGCT